MENDLTQLGPYKLETRLGAGGMGEVWKAEDTRLRRAVAIKILPAAISHDPEARGRLVREARTAAQLYHPNIATIHSIEQEGERSFIVMELVEGVPLAQLIRERAIGEADVIRIARSVAAALAEAHSRGIVHRDIKPDNVIVSGEKVKVLDFGIAKQIGYSSSIAASDPTGVVTEAGVILGTIHYMSPEQALGKPLDARTDIFSLGVVMYEALAGVLPFRGDTVTETLTSLIRDEPEDIEKVAPSISPELAAIVRRCMKKNREERFANAKELSQALDLALPSALTAKRTVATPPRPKAAAATVVTSSPAPSTSRRHNLWLWILIPVALIVGVAGSMFFQRVNRAERMSESVAQAPAPVAPSTKVNVSAAPVTTASATVPPPTTTLAVETASPVVEQPKEKPAVASTPAEPSAEELYARGESLRNSGRLKDAMAAYEAAAAEDPRYPQAHIRIGEAALARRDNLVAAAEFERAASNPGRLSQREVLVARLGLAIAGDSVEEAKRYLRDFEASYPDDPEFRMLRREFLRSQKGGPRIPPRRRRF